MSSIPPASGSAAGDDAGAPFFQQRAVVLLVAAAMTCLMAVWVISFQLPAYGAYSPGEAATLATITATRWTMMGIIATLIGLRVGFRGSPSRADYALMGLGGVVLVYLILSAERYLWVRVGGERAISEATVQGLFMARYGPGMLLLYFTFIGMGAGVRRLRLRREQWLEMARMEAELARARLRAAQEGVRPELLLDSLERVGREMEADPHTADRSLMRVADFLRLALRGTRAERVPLAREVEFVRAYLQLRGAGGADGGLRAEIDPAASVVPVPHSAVLALVEALAPDGAGDPPRPIALRASVEDGGLLLLRFAGDGVDGDAAGRLRAAADARGTEWRVVLDGGGAA